MLKKSFSILFCFLFLQITAQEHFTQKKYSVKPLQTYTYAHKNSQNLFVDVYEPENDFKNRPVFIFMHGGGFGYGSPRNKDEVKLAKTAAEYGYVAVQISYRLTRKNKSFGCDFSAEGKIDTFRKAAIDFLDAVQFVRNLEEKLNIDPDKIIVGGSSAGAEAVLSAVFNQKILLKNSQKYTDLQFSGILSLAGAIPDARYINKENAVPTIFFHGIADNVVPYNTAPHHFCEPSEPGYLILDGSKAIANRLKSLEISYILNSFQGKKHEISRIPFDYLDQVFQYFDAIFLHQHYQQTEIIY